MTIETAIVYLDEPPAGWFVLEVMRCDGNPRGRDWTALMIDVDPDELKPVPAISRHCSMSTPRIIVPGSARLASVGFVSPASTGTGMPHGRLLRT